MQIKNERIDDWLPQLQEDETKTKIKPFIGGLAALQIQPDPNTANVKNEQKFFLKPEPATQPTLDLKRKLEPFTGSLAPLPVRPIFQSDVKPLQVKKIINTINIVLNLIDAQIKEMRTKLQFN